MKTKILCTLMLMVLFISAGELITQARASAPPGDLVTANGIALQAGTPLPVFRFAPPQVDTATAADLADRFSSVAGKPVFTDTYQSRVRFTVPNTDTLTSLEQYGATGGFYIFNASEAFSETVRAGSSFDKLVAQRLSCQFLLNKGLMPANVMVPGAAQQCDLDFQTNPYKTSEAWAAGLNIQNGTFTQQQIGLMVQVPMSIDTSPYTHISSVPLGGAGGHMSLFYRTTAAGSGGFSLDNSVPGLSALALPFYGRNFTFLRIVPSLDAAQVTRQVSAQVRAAYPGATVTVTAPLLMYMVSDAGTPQTALEPKFVFQGIQVTQGGNTFVLRDIIMPAVQSGPGGFGAVVTITAPPNGSTFTPGASVMFAATVSGGAGPYTYTWSLQDGTVLGTGTLANSSLPINLTTNQLPAVSHNGVPAGAQVILTVIDSEGAERSAFVTLTPTVAPSAFLPLSMRNATTTSTQAPPIAPASGSAVAFSNYSFGIEQGSDYLPYGPGGPDLPGVVPDVGGFKSRLLSYGWNSVFHWANALAWELDWRDCSLGGIDCTLGVDRADFAYYAGHGGDGGLVMPSNMNSTWVDGSNARFQRLRWVGFSSCRTLRVQGYVPPTEPIRRWFNAFQGAHMLLGFNSNMADIAFGGPLIDNMRMPFFQNIPLPWLQRTIREAWVLTAFNMNAGKPAYLYALGTNGYNAVNDKLPLPTDPPKPRPYPVAWYFWGWWNE